MRLELPKRLAILLAVACLVGFAWQVWLQSDLCPWHLKQSQRGSPRGAAYGSSGHGCPGCLEGSWAALSAPPTVTSLRGATQLEVEPSPRLSEVQLAATSSPRAPPQA